MGRQLTLREYEPVSESSVKYVDETTRRIRLDDEDEKLFDAYSSRLRPNR